MRAAAQTIAATVPTEIVPKKGPRVAPQPGPQFDFLKSKADIGIYGGAAGGGKTWALLLEAMRYHNTPDFSSVIFRRNLTQVTNPGGLWDEAMKLYPRAQGKPKLNPLQFTFPPTVKGQPGAKVRFAHLDSESTVLEWQGSQVPLICFDELTHFSKAQFFYMLSRNRSTTGIASYVRATTNPDASSWVADFISWWIDPATGTPIADRGGKWRWFVRVGDMLVWADSREELVERFPETDEDGQLLLEPKSLTFIPAKLSDNKALTKADPGYRANLLALPTVERERLLGGNWKIKPAAGLYFQRSWCQFVDAAPAGLSWVRAWDLAATPKIESNDPDWTVGVLLGQDSQGFYYVANAARMRGDPGAVEAAIANTASGDGKAVRIRLPQDPGQAGKAQAQYLIRQLSGYLVEANPVSGDKITRFGPVSAQARAGNVRIVKGPWNEDFLTALEGFPEAAHDDDCDALSEAFAGFLTRTDGLIEYYRLQVEKMKEGRPEGSREPNSDGAGPARDISFTIHLRP